MKNYVLNEADLTMNPITGKPVIGKDDQKYYQDSRRSKLNQIERSNHKFYNKLKDYIANETHKITKNNARLAHNMSFDGRASNNYQQRSLSVERAPLSKGKLFLVQVFSQIFDLFFISES